MSRKNSAKPYSLCIIGNSHVAALKQAWTNRAPAIAPDFSATFFSAQNKYMMHLKLDGRVFVPESDFLEKKLSFTSGGVSRIDVDAYDAFVFTGSGFCVDVQYLSAETVTVTGEKFGPVENPVSRACFAAVAEAKMKDALLIQMAGRIASLTKAPILIAAAPYLSENALEDDGIKDDPKFRDVEFLTELVTVGRAAAERVAAGLGAEVIWQDESTVGQPGFTKAEFGLDPVRFSMMGHKGPTTDRRHGNEDYGFLVLMKMLRRLDEISGGRVLANTTARKEASAV